MGCHPSQEQDMGDESLRKMLKACNSLSGSSNDALESIRPFEITAAMDRYLDGDEEKKWADRGGDQRVCSQDTGGRPLSCWSPKIEAEIQKGKERSTAFPFEELFMNIDLQLCALKSGTRAAQGPCGWSSRGRTHPTYYAASWNRLPVTDRFEQREKWARSVLVDLASERCFQITWGPPKSKIERVSTGNPVDLVPQKVLCSKRPTTPKSVHAFVPLP